MKTILTFVLVLVLGATSYAQDIVADSKKVAPAEKGIVTAQIQNKGISFENTVARVHKFKNDRVKKELVFTTKRNKAKLA